MYWLLFMACGQVLYLDLANNIKIYWAICLSVSKREKLHDNIQYCDACGILQQKVNFQVMSKE